METKKGKHGVEWVDIYKPTEKDLLWIKETFKIHPVIIDELRSLSTRAKVEAYDDYLYFIYYFPLYDPADKTSIRTEIDFIVTKKTVLTVHYEPLKGILAGFTIDELDSTLTIMHKLIDHLIIFEERQLRHIREKVEAVSKEIFENHEKEVLEQISYLKRDISEYRIVVRLQEPIFHSLLAKGGEFWKKDAEVYLNDLIGSQMKVINQLEDYREAVSDFEETNNQLMNLKINSAMKTFTTLSFLTFPFVLIATLLSMNIPNMPIVGLPHAFWIIVSAMAGIMIVLSIYFRKRGWF